MKNILEIDVGFGCYCLYKYDAPSFVIRQLGGVWFDLVNLCYSAEIVGTLPKLDSLTLIYCTDDKNDLIQYVCAE